MEDLRVQRIRRLADEYAPTLQRLAGVTPVERPEDCDAPCWRNQPDGGPCTCDDETEGGVWQPGC